MHPLNHFRDVHYLWEDHYGRASSEGVVEIGQDSRVGGRQYIDRVR